MEFGFLPVLPPWKEACLVPYYLLFMPLHPSCFQGCLLFLPQGEKGPPGVAGELGSAGARARPGGPG